ncbi:DUF1214 domain-containing protein [Pseudochrobactrum sp. HB0163]|uniref:DUF1214 domain-containing protein n=1 Tax=Pseudochrobactrum sp. HB0163 TaxID=3450708 RepID=UPI003F6DFE84
MTFFRTLFLAGLICLIALAGGAASALYMLDHFDGFNRLTIGQWHASPLYGSADADPYARAQRSRAALLPLGSAEGQRFVLRQDDKGAPLKPDCDYILQGKTPAARFWTLYATDLQDRPMAQQQGLPQKLHSQMIWYQEGGDFRITISKHAQGGNWLALNSTRPYQLVMTLYDTDLGTSIGFENPQMPVLHLISNSCAENGQ